jgi:hypothetical protein
MYGGAVQGCDIILLSLASIIIMIAVLSSNNNENESIIINVMCSIEHLIVVT